MLAPNPKNGVTFHWHVQDEETLAISNFVVHGKRRDGTGTRIFKEWEASIPAQFTKIELRAISEDAEAFWASLGFTPHPQLGRNCDGELYMVKPVNQPTAEARPKFSSLSM